MSDSVQTILGLSDELTKLKAERDALTAEVARLREALEGVMGSMTLVMDDPSRMDDMPSCIAARDALKGADND